jgi:Protein of unknown function (DUF2808)
MYKLLIYPMTVCAIFAIAIVPSGYASANNDNSTLPHIDGNYQFPQTKWSNVRHTLRIHIPKNGQSVSQISIAVPETLNWSNKIKDVIATENKGGKVNTNISLNKKNIILTFNEPLPPDSHLEIDIKNVKQPFHGNGLVYRLFAKSTGSNLDIPIGIARFRVY